MFCYFHLVNGDTRILDEEGLEVADVDEARVHAREAVAEIIKDGEMEIASWDGWHIEVAAGDGSVICTLDLRAEA